jgi:DHA2 family lincomycin resistance protein-like MFS transporter
MTNLGETTQAPLDVLSVVLSALSFGGIVYGLSQFGAAHGTEQTTAVPPWVPILVGSVALVAFILRQLSLQRRDDALLDLRVFASANYTVCVLIMAVVALSMFGTFGLLPLYLQDVAGLKPTAAGLVMLPGSVLMGVLGPLMGRIYDARGPKTLLVPGTIMVAAALFFYSTASEHTATALLVTAQTVMSLGLAASFTPLFSASLGSLTKDLYSHGSAALNTIQQVFGAAGTAVLISIYSTSLHSGKHDGLERSVAGAHGSQGAFLVGACIACVPVILAFLVRKPEEED